MLEVLDYSSRRGVIVPLLPQVYALMDENARMDKLSELSPPGHKTLWRQSVNAQLKDPQTRWLFALQSGNLMGLMFYHFSADGRSAYLDELQIAWKHRRDEIIFKMLMDKFQLDSKIRACVCVYAGKRIRNEESKELLASVGFKDECPDGYQPLGVYTDAVKQLTIRYHRN